jgi:hypothetical protein
MLVAIWIAFANELHIPPICPCVAYPQICRHAELVDNTNGRSKKRTKDMVCNNDYCELE